MVRKLAIAAFALSALSTGVAQALGLGEATVQSSLNQPLTAEIELVNVRDLEENEILTGLADRAEFSRAGVDRVFFLSDLRFKVELNQQGNAVIKVTSSKPVREPFLNFLVEVNWPSGRLLREYALLIDPPTFGEERATPVQLATTPAQSAQADTPAAVPQPPRTSGPQTDSAPAGTAPPAKAETQSAADAGNYGPTVANDTLWSIAMQTRPNPGISPQKMMLAIQDLNPDAFLRNNINRLKKGQVLRLPTIEEINRRSSREAIAAVVEQNEAIKARPARPEASANQQAVADSGESGEGARDELRIVVDEATDSITGSPSSTGSARSTAGTANVAGSNDQALVQEQLDLRNRENEELKSRLEELQQQLETMQRLVSLKDDQLAAMQGEAGLERSQQPADPGELMAGTDDSANMLADDSESTAAPDDNRQARDGNRQAGDGNREEGSQTAVGDRDINASASAAGADAGSEAAGDAAGELNNSQPMASLSQEMNQPVAPDTPPEALPLTDRIIGNIKNNTLYQGALAAGGVLLLLLLWLASRRKSADEDEFAESDLQSQSGGNSLGVNSLGVNSLGETAIGATAFDRTALGAKALGAKALGAKALDVQNVTAGTDIPTDESADPMAEADVYLAYQKHDQAARVLEAALEEHPGNQDYRLKLLEVLGESKNTAKFVAVLAALEATGDADILERADHIKSRFTDLAGDADVSLDDLESQLLASDGLGNSDSFGNEDGLADGELSDDFELDVDIGESAELEDTVRKSEAAADFLESNDFDLNTESEIDVKDDLDIDFDLSDIDLDDNDVSSEDLAGELGNIDFGDDDLKDAGQDSSLPAVDDDDTLLSASPAETDFDLDSPVDDGTLTPADELELDEEFAGLDKFEGLSAEGPEGDTVSDPSKNTVARVDENSLELDLDDIDISRDEESVASFDDVIAGELGTQVAGDDNPADIDLEDTVNYPPVAEDSATDEFDLDSTIDSSLDDTIAQHEPAGGHATSQEEVVADIEEDFDFLSDTDEAATKLDLARAYVDMGDKEGARDILEEVAEEGSDEQKQEALELLKTLD